MLKYNKTYPYLFSLLHPSVQAYHIKHKPHIAYWDAEKMSFQTTDSDFFYHVLQSQNYIETFLKKNYENKKQKKKIESGAFSMVGRGR